MSGCRPFRAAMKHSPTSPRGNPPALVRQLEPGPDGDDDLADEDLDAGDDPKSAFSPDPSEMLMALMILQICGAAASCDQPLRPEPGANINRCHIRRGGQAALRADRTRAVHRKTQGNTAARRRNRRWILVGTVRQRTHSNPYVAFTGWILRQLLRISPAEAVGRRLRQSSSEYNNTSSFQVAPCP